MEKHTTHAIIHSEKEFFIKKKKETKKRKITQKSSNWNTNPKQDTSSYKVTINVIALHMKVNICSRYAYHYNSLNPGSL